MKAFRSFFSQNSIDHLLRILSVINACKRILLGRTYQFRFLLIISYNNIQEQEQHQNTEASHKQDFITRNEFISLLCTFYRNCITDHPVIVSKRHICQIPVLFFSLFETKLHQTTFANFKIFLNILKSMLSFEIFFSVIFKKIDSICDLRTRRRTTVKGNDLSITCGQKTVSRSIKKIIKKHMAQRCNITGSAQHTDHFMVFVYRHT